MNLAFLMGGEQSLQLSVTTAMVAGHFANIKIVEKQRLLFRPECISQLFE